MSNQYVRFSGANPFASQAKILLHHDRLNEYLTTGDTSPIFMEVGLTDKCNETCYWCITENGRDNIAGAEIKIEPLEAFLYEFAGMGGKAITYCGQGEPTKYPAFERAVLTAVSANLELGLMTNGVYPERYNDVIGPNFQWIRISLDTLDEEKYKQWKGVDGVRVIRRNILALEKHPVKVGLNCNVGPNITVDMIKALVAYTDDTAAVAYLQFRPILPRYYKTETGLLNDEVWQYLDTLKDNPRIYLSNDKREDLESGNLFPFRSCEGHFFEPILTAKGEVKVCTYHPTNSDLTFGSIYDNSFSEIWKSEQRQQAIKAVRTLDYKNRCQVCCKLSEPNRLLDFLKHPAETNDINFL